MQHYKQESCLNSISNHEIMLAINNKEIDIVIVKIGYINDSHNTVIYYDTRSNEKIMDLSVKGTHNNNISTGAVKKFKGEGEDVIAEPTFILFGTPKHISYDNVLLTPSSVRTILNKRGALCSKHVDEVLKEYFLDTFDRLKFKPLLCTEWLIFCMLDLNIPLLDVVPNSRVATIRGRNLIRFDITQDQVNRGLMDTYYNIVLDNIEIYDYVGRF